MTRYAVFLRGVNVGGVAVTMADLRRVLADLPLGQVSTLLASGNVVCTFAGSSADLKEMVERALRDGFGYDAWVVVLTAERLGELLDGCPYPADSPDTHTYVTVTNDPLALDGLAAAVSAVDPEAEETRLGPEAVAWLAPVGATLSSVRSTVASRSRHRSAVTDRNLRTMIKVRAALDALAVT
ncbi:DUF1697 domain-containing protein [Cellulomonas sp. KRMCY2]|uniref:DUF1697 domain-containing protein n=1 Tax=Cellulomonas sp. KRMCY2 TaxID=1304865 RepID=UPI00045E6207|nr:DUF1697 domain-containing protein [Cellulomonas sp. KRMCY2]